MNNFMKQYKMDWISRDQIRIDPSLKFRIEPEDKRQAYRIELIPPVLVFPRENNFILIDGFRRILSLSPTVQKIPALIWQESFLSGILEGIKLNYTTHPFEIIEEIRIVQYLTDNGYSPDMIKKAVPEIRAPVTLKYLSEFKKILMLPYSLQYYFKQTQASFKQINIVSSFPYDIIEVAVTSLPLFNIKLKDFLVILDCMESLRQRAGITQVKEYIQILIDEISEKEKTPGNWWKIRWRELAYPQLFNRQGELEKLRDSVADPECQINFDRNMEDRSLTIQIKINQISDLERMLRKMQEHMFQSKVKKMLEILRE